MTYENPRFYGHPPYCVVVVHGGPGALGGMAPVARELAKDGGVLEPIQTAASLAGQVEELRCLVVRHARPPIVLIGSSWGAMLGFLLAAEHPELVGKLILVGSGVYEDCYASGILDTRMARLDERQRKESLLLIEALADPRGQDKDHVMARLGAIWAVADAYAPEPHALESTSCRFAIHQAVWADAEALRRDGGFLERGGRIRCPVVAIHGDYDPHPAEGVRKPLSGVVRDFRFVLLEHCGHLPWTERDAKEAFYRMVREAIR